MEFKTFFANEYRDLKEDQRVQAGAAGYGTANNATHIHKIGTALDNLALATTNDQKMMEQLIKTNVTLTKNNKQLSQQLQTAIEAIESIKKDTDQQEAKHIAKIKKYEAKLDPNGYCSTHSFKVVKGHNSMTCTCKGPNHNDNVTRENPMGGSRKNKDWVPMA